MRCSSAHPDRRIRSREWGQKVFDAMRRAIPSKRLGHPKGISGVVAFMPVRTVSGGLTMYG
jgi:2-hydroxycyclohexanecarboxyl-CoA dehydrogenase